MQFDDKILVMVPKGTPPADPSTPAAFTQCTICKCDLVFDARNQPRMKAEGIKPYCGNCAADLVLHSCQPTIGRIQGMTAGKDSMDGVGQFLDQLATSASRRPN